MTISETIVTQFIKRNFDYENFPNSELSKFMQLVAQNKDIAAAKEYYEVTGATLEEAHLAVSFAKSL